MSKVLMLLVNLLPRGIGRNILFAVPRSLAKNAAISARRIVHAGLPRFNSPAPPSRRAVLLRVATDQLDYFEQICGIARDHSRFAMVDVEDADLPLSEIPNGRFSAAGAPIYRLATAKNLARQIRPRLPHSHSRRTQSSTAPVSSWRKSLIPCGLDPARAHSSGIRSCCGKSRDLSLPTN